MHIEINRSMQNNVQKIGEITFSFRLFGYAFLSLQLVLGAYLSMLQYDVWVYLFFVLSLVIPHIGYRAYLRYHSDKVEWILLLLDTIFASFYIVLIRFSLLPFIFTVIVVTANSLVIAGKKQFLLSFLVLSASLFLLGFLYDFEIVEKTSIIFTLSNVLGLVIYFYFFAYANYQYAHWLKQAKLTLDTKNAEMEQQQEEILTQKENIEKQNEELQTLNESKNYYISILAHDLRNPLTQIKGLLFILQTESLQETQKQYVQMIENSTNRMIEMIDNLLDVEAIESKKMTLENERLDAIALLQNTLEGFQSQIVQKNIQLTTHFGLEEAFIFADQNLLIQVYENLISNAIKYTPLNKKIEIMVIQKDRNIEIAIKNEGEGISAENMPRLFGKFQRLNAKPTAGEPSIGLGLAIVKQYVETMQGKVWCESIWNEHATFFLSFPLC
ncbi:MAG: GHKL domain-containing protein [Cytophagales bacterium]|nr:MAG: GHKL domain-containing protein [Cytophagales bacterium]